MKTYKLTTNLGLKIIAFIFAVFLWLIVVNLDNPVGSKIFTDIPVTIVNEDIITSEGEVYQVEGDQTVSVVVYATREVRQELNSEDIVATADIKQMDSTGRLVPIEISIPDHSDDYESAEAVPRNLTIQREKSGKKVLSLTINTDGTSPAEGYILGDMSVEPEQVTITGAESLLAQIDHAEAKIDVSGIAQDEELEADLILYDVNGNQQSQSQIGNNLGETGLTVSVEVLRVKSIPVTFSVTGTPAAGYKYTGCTSVPENVQVCGKSGALDKIEKIEVPASVFDISGVSESIERVVDITGYLPEGVELVDENAGNISVTVKIEQEGTRTIEFMVSSIKIDNLSENLQVSYKPDAEITLHFTGDESQLGRLDISNAVSVDLKEYTKPGTYNVPVKVNVPSGITLDNNEVTVELTIQEKAGTETENQGTGDGE